MSNEKIGIVTACMNRRNMINVSLQSWLNFKEISEIIIVDWNSVESLKDLEELDPRIKVIRVENEEFFNIGKAFNLGFKTATADKILKMDVDYILNPYFNLFQSEIKLTKDTFITGNWMDKVKDNKMGFMVYLNGFIYLHKENFEKCEYSGWDNYGWDDDDLYNCLQNNNLKRVKLYDTTDTLFIYHNPHDDKVRTENYKSNELMKNQVEFKRKPRS